MIMIPLSFTWILGGIIATDDSGNKYLLFVGIIDILQSYVMKKKLEHTWKAMLHDGVCVKTFILT